jgi:hypothetical protein
MPMKKSLKNVLGVSVFIAALLLIVGILYNGKTTLELRLESDKSAYIIGETVRVKYRAINMGQKQITMPGSISAEDITILLDNGRHAVKTETITYDVRGSGDEYITLKHGESHELLVSHFDRSYFGQPGVWRVRTNIKLLMLGNNPGKSVWTGSLKSNELIIEIRANR